MGKYKDILLDENGDLAWENGDLVIGDPVEQDVKTIIITYPGCWRFSPLVGVGISRYQNSFGRQTEIKRLIGLQLQADGMIVDHLDIAEDLQIKFKVRRL